MSAVSSAPVNPARWPHIAARWQPALYLIPAALWLLMPWRSGVPMVVQMFRPNEGRTIWDLFGSAGPAVMIMWLTALMIGVAGCIRHGRQLCLTCAGRFPVNPQAAAEKHRWQLRITHAIRDHRWARPLILLGTVIASLIAPSGWATNTSMSAALLGLALTDYAGWTHAALQLWCPLCRDDGDDDEVSEPAPDSGNRLPLAS